MRRMVVLLHPVGQVRRLILYEAPDGVHLFLSDSKEDRGSFADEWYVTIEDAEQASLERFGVDASQWEIVPEPLPGCQADWIAPVRVRGREGGKPDWGKLERLEGDVWTPLSTDQEE